MPPKVAVIEPAVEAAPLTSVRIKIKVESLLSESSSKTSNIRIRLVSDWLDCCVLTDVFGEGTLSWEMQGGSEEDAVAKRIATFKSECGSDLSTNKERLRSFNVNPGIYAIIMGQEERPIEPASDNGAGGATVGSITMETRLVPLGFLYADCSTFLIEPGQVLVRGQSLENLNLLVEMEISVADSFLPRTVAWPLEPLVLDIKRWGSPGHHSFSL